MASSGEQEVLLMYRRRFSEQSPRLHVGIGKKTDWGCDDSTRLLYKYIHIYIKNNYLVDRMRGSGACWKIV